MVAEATANVVKVASTTADTDFSITVVNLTNRPVGGVAPQLGPFVDGSGKAAPARLDAEGAPVASFALKPYGSRSLNIHVTAARPGVFAAKLWLGGGATALVTTIEVTRTDAPPALTIGNSLPFKVKAAWFGPTTTALQTVRVTQTGGAGAVELSPPQRVSVLYKPDEKVTLDAPGVTLVEPAASASAPPFLVAPNDHNDISYAFTGFPSAGRYEAVLSFSSPASAPVTRTVSIYVRENWPMAALWIGLGVVVAFLLRVYGTVLAPRLALESRAAALFAQLRDARASAAPNDAAASAVADAMHGALLARWNTLASTGRLVGSTDLDLYEQKIPLLRDWLQLRAWLGKHLPPATQVLAQTTLNSSEAVLRNPAATAAEISAQAAALAGLPLRLDQSAVAELGVAVTELRNALHGSADPRLQALNAALTTLSATMPHDAASMVHFAAALNGLRLDRAHFLIADLHALLARPAPRQFPLQWPPLTAGCTRVLNAAAADADAQIAAYTDAFARLGLPIASAVAAEAGAAAALAGPHAGDWQLVQSNAQTVLAGIAARPPTGAPADLAALLDDSQALHDSDARLAAAAAAHGRHAGPAAMPQALPAGLNIGALIASAPAAAGAGWLNFIGYGPTAERLDGPAALANARRRELRLSVAALLVIGALAIAAGVQALWANNWVWGGATAYLIAFLWGAGLSGFTFDGVKNLFAKWSQ